MAPLGEVVLSELSLKVLLTYVLNMLLALSSLSLKIGAHVVI